MKSGIIIEAVLADDNTVAKVRIVRTWVANEDWVLPTPDFTKEEADAYLELMAQAAASVITMAAKEGMVKEGDYLREYIGRLEEVTFTPSDISVHDIKATNKHLAKKEKNDGEATNTEADS